MIGEGDDAVFFNPADFAEVAEYLPAAGGAFPLPGIFTARHATIVAGDFAGVSTVQPGFTISAAAIPAGVASDLDRLRLRGGEYVVRDAQPDGGGLLRLILERA